MEPSNNSQNSEANKETSQEWQELPKISPVQFLMSLRTLYKVGDIVQINWQSPTIMEHFKKFHCGDSERAYHMISQFQGYDLWRIMRIDILIDYSDETVVYYCLWPNCSDLKDVDAYVGAQIFRLPQKYLRYVKEGK